jgi:hypothetical protein
MVLAWGKYATILSENTFMTLWKRQAQTSNTTDCLQMLLSCSSEWTELLLTISRSPLRWLFTHKKTTTTWTVVKYNVKCCICTDLDTFRSILQPCKFSGSSPTCINRNSVSLTYLFGHSSVQIVSCWLPTGAHILSQARSCGICGGQSGTGIVFSKYFDFPCQFSFHQLLHTHYQSSSRAGTIGQIAVDVPNGLSLTPP